MTSYNASTPSSDSSAHAETIPTDPSQLAVEHMALVTNLVREISGRIPASVDRDDLKAAGLVALVNAAQAFDQSRGVPFTAYAITRIRGALLDELRSIDWATRSVRRRGREIEETRQRLATAHGAFPDNHMVGQALGLTTVEVVRADAEVARASVLPLQGSEMAMEELLPTSGPGPAELTERAERMAFLADAITELPERLRVVVTAYFLEERPMAEIGLELGVTESRISQLRAEALVLLRDALTLAFDNERPVEVPQGVAARRRRTYTDAVAHRHAARRPTRALVPQLV